MKKLRILLVCSAGMSTSMLVKKMQDYCRKIGLNYEIEAMSSAMGKPQLDQWDICLIGPQVSYIANEFKSVTKIPVEIIPSQIYALGKGDKAIEFTHKILGITI